jgi:hypothetical protein
MQGRQELLVIISHSIDIPLRKFSRIFIFFMWSPFALFLFLIQSLQTKYGTNFIGDVSDAGDVMEELAGVGPS